MPSPTAPSTLDDRSTTRPSSRPDPRAQRSRDRLVDALNALLARCNPEDISVSALCAQAGVSRPTFYQHFATLDDVAVAGVERRFTALRAALSGEDGPELSSDLLTGFLADLDAQRQTWQRTIGCPTAFASSRDAVETWLADRLAERAPTASATTVRYAAAGFLGVVRAWLLEADGPGRATPAELASGLAEVSARVLRP